jgi:hypothetical protein
VKSETAKQLEAILSGREMQKQASAAKATEQQKAEAKNLADFLVKKEETIKPALQELVGLYKAKGVSIRIVEEEEHPNETGGTASPYIRLDMAGAYTSYAPMKPEFRLTFEKRNRTLSVYTSTGSQSGPAGSVSLDAVTPDWIQDAFLKYQSGH